MNLAGELLLLAGGILISAAANGSRTAIPELVNQKGRDPSDRRREAATRLRSIWLARVAGLVLVGVSSTLLSSQMSYPRWISAAVIAFLSFLLSEVLLPIFVQHLPEGRARKLFTPPMAVLNLFFRLPAKMFLGREDNSSDDWAYTPPNTLWLEQRREKGDQEELEKEQELVDSILEFSDKIVREVMVPRIDMDSIELCDNIGSIVAQVKKAGHSRIPVYRKIIDDIAGVLYAKDLLGVPLDAEEGEFRVEDIIREAYFVPEFKRIDQLFTEFQSKRIHMAVVIDEYGGIAGIVTMEDIVEEVFGEIRDEFDSEPPMVRSVGDDSYRVDARLPIDDLNDLLGTDFEEEENYESVGGLVFHQLGHIPETGEFREIDNWIFTVEKVIGQRIVFVKVSPGTGEED
ncbi:MAG: hemolysin family protein [Candidatus Fermentibacteria bacterium]|nr:hemolysin family protein [Candidatus Fermentibacteria bacterium]